MTIGPDVIIDAPPNERPMDEVFVFASLDEHGEGICAHVLPGIGAVLLVTAKRSITESMKEPAAELAKASGKPIRLIRFTRAEILWETKP